jgi:AcrR family transcriptional regulator
LRKTDQKRQHILDTAYRLFQSKGFANTSMSEITAEAGGSKATVYNYFSSKDELFLACMTSITNRFLEGVFDGLKNPKAEMSAALLEVAKNALRHLCSPEMLASKRLIIAEAHRSEIGKLFYGTLESYLKELAEFLRRAMDDGQLRQADPMVAAHQFRALVEADIVERCLLGAVKAPPATAALSRAAQNAVATFFRAYAPQGDGNKQVVKPAPDGAPARKSALK